MLRLLFGVFISLTLIGDTYAQSHLSKEIDRLNEANRPVKKGLLPIKATFPCEIYSELSAGSCYIGISDVGQDTLTAYRQAYLRALSMVALRNAEGRGMNDFFNQSGAKRLLSNYEEFCRLSCSFNLAASAIRVSKPLVLRSGEMVLFVSIDTTNASDNQRIQFSSNVELYYKETEADGHRELQSLFKKRNLCVKKLADSLSESATYTQVNERFRQEIVLDGINVTNNKYKVFYKPSEECKRDTIGYETKGRNTTDGLWVAFANSVYGQLSAQLIAKFQKVKNVGDRYQNESISLNRESGLFGIDCCLTDVVYFENKLYTRIKTEFPVKK